GLCSCGHHGHTSFCTLRWLQPDMLLNGAATRRRRLVSRMRPATPWGLLSAADCRWQVARLDSRRPGTDASSNVRRWRDDLAQHGTVPRPRIAPAAPGSRVISFVWSPGIPLPAGTGGSENYTVGQVRELNRRGVDARVVTIGLGTADGRAEFDDIP